MYSRPKTPLFRHLPLVCLMIGAGVLGAQGNAWAFKLRSHVAIANQAMAEVFALGGAHFPKLGFVSLHNDEVLTAVRNHPGAFRMGILGPDVFPDLYAGQLWVHVDNGNPHGLNRSTCSQTAGCVSGDVPFENRTPFKQWRSVDYGMFLLKRAMEHRRGDGSAEGVAERRKAIAFAYGYLSHMIGDGFAHSYVNEWSRSVFDYTKGRAGALFGPLTEEIQHLAVEGYIDLHLPRIREDKLHLETPTAFLKEIYTAAHGPEQGLNQATEAGAFGGTYFEQILAVRNKLAFLANRDNWDRGLSEPVSKVATLGTHIGDPLEDIVDYFRQRRDILDATLDGWLQLSDCIARNLIRGANAGPSELVTEDACADINFERAKSARDLFRGQLNEAAHHGGRKSNFDFGRAAANLKKQMEFVKVVLTRALVFNPLEDIRSLRVIKNTLLDCNEPLVKWKTCENACNTANQTCKTVVVDLALCLGCPKEDGKYTCSGLSNGIKCVALGHCIPCAGQVPEIVAEPACVGLVNSAAPVCELCGKTSGCASLTALDQGHEALSEFKRAFFDRILDPVVNKALHALLDTYAGPYAHSMIDIYQQFEKRRKDAKATWFVNIAFLKEDMRRDPEFLGDVLAQSLGLSIVTVNNAASVATAIFDVHEQTRGLAQGILREFISPTQNASYDSIWLGMVEVLVKMARERNFDALSVEGQEWLDKFEFRQPGEVYETRFGRFVGLMNALTGLSHMRGATARALRRSMGLSDQVFDDGGGTLPVHVFPPVHNAIELTKMSFASRDGLVALGSAARLSQFGGPTLEFTPAAFQSTSYRPSQICTQVPHVICDAIQSLDDPNHFGHRMAPDTQLEGGREVDSQRSFDVPDSAFDAQLPGSCSLGLTNFLLGGKKETVKNVYEKMFFLPARCQNES